MANRTVQVDILADEKNFVRGTAAAGTATSKLSQVLSKLGPVGQGIQSLLNNIGLGGIGMAGGVAAGAAAVGAAAAFINHAIDQYEALGEKVRTYAAVTGESAQEASRQVQAFGELGVSAETAQNAMFKLGKQAETSEKKLNALGVQVAHDSSGNVDLHGTLLNVINAYQGTTDAGQRALIVFTAFGKGGQAMIPILEENATKLKQLEDRIKLVYTDADLERIRKAKIAQNELDQSWQQLADTIGRDFLPAKAAAIDSMNENIYVANNLDAAMQKAGITNQSSRIATMEVARALRAQYQAAQSAKFAVDDLAQSQQAAANAAKAEADAEDKLYTALEKNTSAGFAYEQSLIDLKNAQDTVAAGTGNATENNLRLREAYVKVADAAVAQAEAQAAANGTTVSAAQKADLYRQKLLDLMGQLGPGDPLRQNLQGYIDELNSIPSAKSTIIDYSAPRAITGFQAFAEGGMVGGSSAEHPVMARSGEMVLTPEQQAALPAQSGAQSGGVRDIHIHVTGLISDGPTIDLLANAVALRLGYSTGR